ncbi:hypothetical protein [Bradyrhizobium betae]|uniref:Four-carbon acid sugar kinase N-terminal domain-containing protein n=1 Tax=Bradyrhizobium betae TaxID=244734 RepID=A0A4Q1UPW9_9BRAD|nr:hypothetical protein [Bradyrhizobium betae]RXT36397.1 hypothetical protein B5V03_32535 [Bradyrhizobium betae]
MRTNSQYTIGILADDLTSATDGAGPQELEPGFPLGRASLEGGRELLIATKAGGFGDDNTLRRAIAQLRFGASVSEQVL